MWTRSKVSRFENSKKVGNIRFALSYCHFYLFMLSFLSSSCLLSLRSSSSFYHFFLLILASSSAIFLSSSKLSNSIYHLFLLFLKCSIDLCCLSLSSYDIAPLSCFSNANCVVTLNLSAASSLSFSLSMTIYFASIARSFSAWPLSRSYLSPPAI